MYRYTNKTRRVYSDTLNALRKGFHKKTANHPLVVDKHYNPPPSSYPTCQSSFYSSLLTPPLLLFTFIEINSVTYNDN